MSINIDGIIYLLAKVISANKQKMMLMLDDKTFNECYKGVSSSDEISEIMRELQDSISFAEIEKCY